MQDLLDGMAPVHLEPGQELFHQGDDGDAMFVIERGQLQLQRELPPEGGDELPIRTMGPGTPISGRALLFDQPHSVSVSASGDQSADLWRLSREHFRAVAARLHKEEQEEEQRQEEADGEESCEIDFANLKSIFVVSDGTGSTCAKSLELALKQFDICYEGAHGYAVTTFPYVRGEEEVRDIVGRAREEGALVVFTLMEPQARAVMQEEVARKPAAEEGTLRAVDLWEPMIVQLEDLLGAKREPQVAMQARRREVSDDCLRMIDAIEFAEKMDDGLHPEMWHEADIILIGLSRAGKTPLAYFLAQRGFKVANYPAVPGEEPPDELFLPELQDRCVALVIAPERLQRVRNVRMKEYGRKTSSYSTLATCAKEVSWLKEFYLRKGPRWPIIDTTNIGVEECAAQLLKTLEQRQGRPVKRLVH